MFFLLVHFVASVLIASQIGGKRKIGQGWSFFFCLCFSLLVGFIVSYSSPINNNKKVETQVDKGLLALYLGLASLLFLVFCFMMPNPKYSISQVVPILLLSVGFFGAAIYIKDPNLLNQN